MTRLEREQTLEQAAWTVISAKKYFSEQGIFAGNLDPLVGLVQKS